MIQKYIDAFMAAKPKIEAQLETAHPENYKDLVTRVIRICSEVKGEHGWAEAPDPQRITVIDHGDYQGTQLYVIGADGYQPSAYWAIFVNYGSCSGCDTFEAIRNYTDEPPTVEQVKEYWTLMLHMVQNMKNISE